MTPLEATEAVYVVAVPGVAAMSGPPLLILAERGRPETPVPWIRLVVRQQPTPPTSHGPPGGARANRGAIVYAQCFYPVAVSDGIGPPMAMAIAVRALFQRKDIAAAVPGTLTFDAADIRERGVEGAWNQVDVTCPFTFDEIV